MSISNISEFTIRRHTNTKSFQRGEAYYTGGAVLNVIQRGNLLQAEVNGAEAKPYRVCLNLDNDGLASGSCTCAYDFEGWCKHIVATMLVCVRQPESIEQRPTLEKLLDCLDHIQTQHLLQELVAAHPQLIEAIDQHVSWMTTNPTPKKQPTQPRNTVNPAPFRQQVRQIIRDGLRYLEDGCEEDPISEELLSLVQTAVDFSEQGDGDNAIAILEAITSTCAENWDDVADYGADNEEIAQELDQAWCEAILTAELTQEEKIDIQVNLETWQDEWNADFAMSLEALRQGWDDPELVQVLLGNITNRGVWRGEVPDYADDLALIRLKILEGQERYQEYLYLAEAEGQTQHYLTMLGRLGKIDEAIAAAQTQMTSMEQAFTLAKTLAQQGALTEALEIAQTGLNLPGRCQYELGFWTGDLAEELGNQEAALLAIRAGFQAKPSLVDYQKIKDLAGENWESIKIDLLKVVRACEIWGLESAKVDIFLFEGLIEDAIAIVTELRSYHGELIHRVMKAAIPHNPHWVIANACRRAESIMDAGKAEYYEEAVNWLKKAQAAYLESGQKVEWLRYRAQLIEIHGRKRKLMGLLKEQDMN
ncbi:zinc finger SWIM domain-containing protein [Cylindrospermum sp. NIES-4074]|nr:zinc finger SWIM domain-containing protein [Cylindrospermum sp. NIES-4074]